MNNTITKRNDLADAVRGFAIVLVVIGHIFQFNTISFSSTVVFNIIWSLQIPLFFLISGFVNLYSTPIDSPYAFTRFIAKRTLTYLLPWFVWTFLIKGLLFSGNSLPELILFAKKMLYSMDSGYWFLFVLWVISMIYGLASYFASKMKKPAFLCNGGYTLLFACILTVPFALIGLLKDASFLGIKYILYYTLFYYLGFIYSKLLTIYENKLDDGQKKLCNQVVQYVVFIFSILWIIIIFKFDLFSAPDTLTNIIIRVVASISGCAATISFLKSKIISNTKIGNGLLMFGTHSLEIYVVHGLFLQMIPVTLKPQLPSVSGVVMCLVNGIFTVFFTWLVIYFINSSRIAKLILFGKKTSMPLQN